jgi:hypothetical protein
MRKITQNDECSDTLVRLRFKLLRRANGFAIVVALLSLAPFWSSARAQVDGAQRAAPAFLQDKPVLAPARRADSGPTIYLADQAGFLGTIDIGTGTIRRVGRLQARPGLPRIVMTDIAFCPDRKLCGISFMDLYEIDAKNARTTLIGSHRIPGLNALVCNKAGQLFSSSFKVGGFYRVSRIDAQTKLLGPTDDFKSAGDLAYHGNSLFWTTLDKKIVRINKKTGKSLSSKTHGIADLFGLVSTGRNGLYGFAGTKAYRLNGKTGKYKELFDFTKGGLLRRINGAAYNGNFRS